LLRSVTKKVVGVFCAFFCAAVHFETARTRICGCEGTSDEKQMCRREDLNSQPGLTMRIC
jgi:hypothetical protein